MSGRKAALLVPLRSRPVFATAPATTRHGSQKVHKSMTNPHLSGAAAPVRLAVADQTSFAFILQQYAYRMDAGASIKDGCLGVGKGPESGKKGGAASKRTMVQQKTVN